MILSGNAILERLEKNEIFKNDTWCKSQIREASYVLRIDDDGMLLEGKFFDPGKPFSGGFITIEPGKIAILSTVERLDMPKDLVGKIGIRLEYALQGLTGLMGIQVDPLYGHGKKDERLYMRVANLGNDPIHLQPGDGVFTFEIDKVCGSFVPPKRDDSWSRIKSSMAEQTKPSWSYVTRIQNDVETVRKDMKSEVESVKNYLQPLVMFGIFLVAVAILGAALTVILSFRDTPEISVPGWVTEWGWLILLFTLCIAAICTALVGAVTAWFLFCQMRRESKR